MSSYLGLLGLSNGAFVFPIGVGVLVLNVAIFLVFYVYIFILMSEMDAFRIEISFLIISSFCIFLLFFQSFLNLIISNG